jgi:hypothetical protein
MVTRRGEDFSPSEKWVAVDEVRRHIPDSLLGLSALSLPNTTPFKKQGIPMHTYLFHFIRVDPS